MSKSFIMGCVTGTGLIIVGLASVSLMISPTHKKDVPATESASESSSVTLQSADQQTGLVAKPDASKPAVAADEGEVGPEIADDLEGAELAKPTVSAETVLPESDQTPITSAQVENPPPIAEPVPALTETDAASAPQTEDVTRPGQAILPTNESGDSQPVAPNHEGTAPILAQSEPLPAEEPADNAGKVLAEVSGAGQKGGVNQSAPSDVPNQAVGAQPDATAKVQAPDAPVSEAPTMPNAGSATPSDAQTPASADTSTPEEAVVEKSKPRMITLNPKPESSPETSVVAEPGTKPEPLPQSVPGVNILRLPNTQADGSSTAEEPTQATAPPPRVAYAENWSNPDNKSILAILILDIGVAAGGLDASALDLLPFPATFALDPEREGATAIAAEHRAAGKEVVILAGDLPDGATDSDLEVAYQSYVSQMPEAVALMGMPDAEFQKSSLAAQHIAALLLADGRGLVTFDRGLNPGRRAAEKAGIAVASVDRLFDSTGTNNISFQRDLDRAAFTAGQKGTYVIALPSTPEAITSLMAWAAGPGPAHVALGPVSAVMTNSK